MELQERKFSFAHSTRNFSFIFSYFSGLHKTNQIVWTSARTGVKLLTRTRFFSSFLSFHDFLHFCFFLCQWLNCMYVEGTILLACCCDNYRDRVVVAQVSRQTNESNPKVFSCLGAGDFFVKVHKHQDNMQSRKRKNAKKEKNICAWNVERAL